MSLEEIKFKAVEALAEIFKGVTGLENTDPAKAFDDWCLETERKFNLSSEVAMAVTAGRALEQQEQYRNTRAGYKPLFSSLDKGPF